MVRNIPNIFVCLVLGLLGFISSKLILAASYGMFYHKADMNNLLTTEMSAALIAGTLAFVFFRILPILPERDGTFFDKLKVVLVLCILGCSMGVQAYRLDAHGGHSFSILLFVAIYTLTVGIFEEIFYRGLLMRVMLPCGATLAVYGSSLAFGLAHMKTYSFIAAINCLPQFTIGLALAMLYVFTKKLWLNIFVHGLWDFLAFTSMTQIVMSVANTPAAPATINWSTDSHYAMFAMFLTMYWMIYRTRELKTVTSD